MGGRPRHHDRSGEVPHGTRLGLVEELRRAEEALEEQKVLAETLLRAQSELGEGVLVVDHGRVIFANEAAGRLTGHTAQELESLDSYLELVAPEHRIALDERLRGLARTPEAVVETVLLGASGTRIPVEIAVKAMNGGSEARLVALVRDLTGKKAAEQHRMELVREQAARVAVERERGRWELLARLGDRLAASIDYEARVDQVVKALVPALADWCALHIQESDGDIRLAAFQHSDVHQAARVIESALPRTVDPDGNDGVAFVLRSGEAQLGRPRQPSTRPTTRPASARPHAAGAHSWIIVPLTARGRTFGSLLLAMDASGRRQDASDLAFAQEVGRRVALSIDNARLHAESQNARTLAESALQERNATLEALRQGQARLRSVVTGSPIALFALDREGRFTLSEGSGLEHLGLMPQRVLGRTVNEVAPQTTALIEQVRQALGGEIVTSVLETKGHAFELRIVPFRSENSEIAGAIGTAMDVTDRHRAEQRREAQYAVSRLLSEAESTEKIAPELLRIVGTALGWNAGTVWLASERNDTLTCTSTWQSMPEPPEGLAARSRATGLRRGEDVAGIVWSTGKPVWLRDATRERAFRRSAAAAQEGLRTLVCVPIVSPREVLGVIELYAAEPREPDEDLLRLFSSIAAQLGVYVERRQALLEVRRLNAELESRVGQRTRELEAANRELEAFSYSVSHDLRAPLRTIDGFSKALMEDYSPTLDQEGQHLLERVRAATQRMAQLIDDLLKLSRITRGDLQRVPVDLGSLVEASIASLSQQDPERRVQVSVQPGHVVLGDPPLLRVAIENLVRNAWKFTRGRDVARIEFGVEERDGVRAYFVRDDGAGFDMSYRDKLFIPFQRLHRASEFEGSGIGLATVHRIIQRHGGRVWAEGSVGKGAVVYFTLPGAK